MHKDDIGNLWLEVMGVKGTDGRRAMGVRGSAMVPVPAELSLQTSQSTPVSPQSVPLSPRLITAPLSGAVEWLSKTPGRDRQK